MFRNKIYKIYIDMPKGSRKSLKKMIGCSMMGGNGATEHGVAVYGAVGQQHAGQGNLIVMKGGQQLKQEGGEAELPLVGGEQQEQEHQEGGKTVIGDLLVPAGLLFASQRMLKTTKKRGGKKTGRKSRRNRRSRRKP